MTSEGVRCRLTIQIRPHLGDVGPGSLSAGLRAAVCRFGLRQFGYEIDDSWVLAGRGLLFRVLLKFRHEFV
jgi:hypothetical protein